MTQEAIAKILKTVALQEQDFRIYCSGVADFFSSHPKLSSGNFPTVYTVRKRLKDAEHLRKKIIRKRKEGRLINSKNVFKEITDIGGVRVLHFSQDQLSDIHQAIIDRVKRKDWVLAEPPKAYTWDPESISFMKSLKLEVNYKESFYTSVHYVVRPRVDSDISCEIQVRTLFEEIWGEIDHKMNYPKPTGDLACREQLLVLAKLVGAGRRLVDSVFRTSQ